MSLPTIDMSIFAGWLENRDITVREFSRRTKIPRARLEKLIRTGKPMTDEETVAVIRVRDEIDAKYANVPDLMTLGSK